MKPTDAGDNDGLVDYYSAVSRVLMAIDGLSVDDAHYVLEVAEAAIGTTKVDAHTADIDLAMGLVGDGPSIDFELDEE